MPCEYHFDKKHGVFYQFSLANEPRGHGSNVEIIVHVRTERYLIISNFMISNFNNLFY